MDNHSKSKPVIQTIRGKVIAAFLLGFITIGLAIAISYFSFGELMNTVDQLSQPNRKLQSLNNLFQKITKLDQKQRADAIENPGKSVVTFLRESKSIRESIDSLREMNWASEQQLERLDAMENILHQRDTRFLRYLKSRSDYVYNARFSRQLDSLATLLTQAQLPSDTSIRTTEKKTTTTLYPTEPESDNGTWLSRLFTKKKPTDVPETKVHVEEEITQKIDTLLTSRQDSAIQQVGLIMKDLEADQRLQNKQIASQELALIRTNTQLINQLLSVLQEVEDEELLLIHKNNEDAASVVTQSTWRIGAVMLVFIIGGVVLIVFIMTDLTKSNYYRKQLIEAKEEAEELTLVKQRFLANMSHEIRTPLQSILGFSEQLHTRDTDNSEALEAIQRSSEHLLHIVNEVLDFSRIESGKFTLEREPFNVWETVNDVASGIRIQIEAKSLSFQLETDSVRDLVVYGDPFRLRQILYNLLGNAAKFTKEGFVKLAVHIIEDKGYTVKLRFVVSDSGMGMRKEDLDKVFEQFEQVQGVSRVHGGTGLGLTIVKKLVEAKNGNLVVTSEIGEGSAFTVELIFDRAPLSQVKVSPTKESQQRKNITGRVMVVDDDPLILRLCEIILTKYKIPFISFNDPTQSLAQPLPPDINLILLDIRMPEVNGVDLCREFRKQGNDKLQIVALTAHVLPQEREKLLEDGFDKVLPKPFREKELTELLGVAPHAAGEEIKKVNQVLPDLNALRQMTMGDDDLFQSVVTQFISETSADLKHLDNYLMQMQGAEMREVIHKLAGRTGQMGFVKLSGKLRSIEEHLAAGKPVTQSLEKIYDSKIELENILLALQEVSV